MAQTGSCPLQSVLSQSLPNHFAVVGLDIKDESTDGFRLRLRDGANGFCECEGVDEKTWEKFTANLKCLSGDFAASATHAALSEQLKAQEKEWKVPANHVFCLATPPAIVETIVHGIGEARLAQDRQHAALALLL